MKCEIQEKPDVHAIFFFEFIILRLFKPELQDEAPDGQSLLYAKTALWTL